MHSSVGVTCFSRAFEKTLQVLQKGPLRLWAQIRRGYGRAQLKTEPLRKWSWVGQGGHYVESLCCCCWCVSCRVRGFLWLPTSLIAVWQMKVFWSYTTVLILCGQRCTKSATHLPSVRDGTLSRYVSRETQHRLRCTGSCIGRWFLRQSISTQTDS
jgi:hypothetical protein